MHGDVLTFTSAYSQYKSLSCGREIDPSYFVVGFMITAQRLVQPGNTSYTSTATANLTGAWPKAGSNLTLPIRSSLTTLLIKLWPNQGSYFLYHVFSVTLHLPKG